MSDNGNNSGHSSEFEYVGSNRDQNLDIPAPMVNIEDPAAGGDDTPAAMPSPQNPGDVEGPTTSAGDALSVYLTSFENVGDSIVNNFRSKKITFSMLASLTANDLLLLGITNEKTRQRMVSEASNLPNQEENYEQIIKRLDIQRYLDDFVNDMDRHKTKMAYLVSASMHKINADNPKDILIGDKNYSSKLCKAVLGEMCEKLDELDVLLNSLKDEKDMDNLACEKCKKIVLRYGIPLGIASFVGFALFKHLKGKLF